MFSGDNTLVTGGTFTINPQRFQGKGGFERLQEATAPGAFHNSETRFDPPKCHPNTRTAVLRRITNWVIGRDADPDTRRAFMLWLSGAAGAGKSAIAQSIAELCQEDGTLLASFFFSVTDPTRNHARSLVATIAYQIALNIPEAKQLIVSVVEDDPLIFGKSLETQFARLIFEPLHSCANTLNPSSRLLIIIDGLDECTDTNIRSSILRLLFNARRRSSLPPMLQFLVASRPEIDILSVLDSQALEVAPIRLVLDNTYHPDEDIMNFIQDKFNDIKTTHPHRGSIPAEWPAQEIIDNLVAKSSGQFIYASTVIKYISSLSDKPTRRLDVVLGLRPAQRENPFADLDALYAHIFSMVDDLHLESVLQVLGLLILDCPFSARDQIEEFLGFQPGDLRVLFANLGSVVSLVENQYAYPPTRIQILHASLNDFLLDHSRSKQYYIYPAMRHAEYAHLCFQYASQGALTERMAFPTLQLQQDIKTFDLNNLNWTFEETQDFTSRFLDCIKSLQCEDADKLYEIHKSSEKIRKGPKDLSRSSTPLPNSLSSTPMPDSKKKTRNGLFSFMKFRYS